MNIDEEITIAVEGFRKNFLQPALVDLAMAESKIETAAKTVDGIKAWTLSEEAEAAFPIGNRVQALRTARLSGVIRQIEKRYSTAVEQLDDDAFALFSEENLQQRSEELIFLNDWGEKIIGYISLEAERVATLKLNAAKSEEDFHQTTQLIGGRSQEAAAEALEKAAAQTETAHLYAAEAEAAAEQISRLESSRPQTRSASGPTLNNLSLLSKHYLKKLVI